MLSLKTTSCKDPLLKRSCFARLLRDFDPANHTREIRTATRTPGICPKQMLVPTTSAESFHFTSQLKFCYNRTVNSWPTQNQLPMFLLLHKVTASYGKLSLVFCGK